MMQMLNPAGWMRPKGYSNGIAAAGRMIFVAGQVGWDREQVLAPGGFVPQFERALENVRAVVECAGGTVDDLCRFTIYVTDRRLYEDSLRAVGEAYRRVMGRHYPAMALVEVAGLLEPGALVEVEATAALAPLAALAPRTTPASGTGGGR